LIQEQTTIDLIAEALEDSFRKHGGPLIAPQGK
jgi:hypothetical protein